MWMMHATGPGWLAVVEAAKSGVSTTQPLMGGLTGWVASVAALLLVWGILYFRRGPGIAMGAVVVLSFLLPTWVKQSIAGLPFGISTTVTIVALAGYAVHPAGKILSPLTLLDFCVACLWTVTVVADGMAQGWSWAVPLRAYGEWALPYVAGRYCVRNRRDLDALVPWAIGVLVVLSLSSIFESFFRVNPFEMLFGDRPEELAKRDAMRLGFKRAFGPTTHAIYFGMLMTVLFPWLFHLWQNRSITDRKGEALVAIFICCAGVAGTVSRSPVLSIACGAIVVACMLYRWVRWPVGIVAVCSVALLAAFPNEVIDNVSRLTGGGHQIRLIEVDGKVAEYSSSRSRLLLMEVYRDAILKAGPFGFGTVAVTDFPPKIPYLEGRAELATRMKIVDNAYVLTSLRLGLVGLAALVLFFVCAIATGYSLFRDRPDQLFPLAACCYLGTMACFSLMMVWMSYDFGMAMLWMIGILSGLASGRIRMVSSSQFGRTA
ncbi:MAG: O-antigen ligase family protein [Planctomycetaceae bacterium]|nr:O-antigen ligase family protein [Planctomycetaceae bacterium]